MQTEPQNFLILDIIIMLGVILKDRGVRADYLKFVVLGNLTVLNFFVANVTNRVNGNIILVLFFYQLLREADHHSSCIFDDIHCLGVKDRNYHERVSTFENLDS